MRVFACYVVSKLQRHRCPTFGALPFRTNNAQTDSYIFIYIDRHTGVNAFSRAYLCGSPILDPCVAGTGTEMFFSLG
jgi:hypothetical protein